MKIIKKQIESIRQGLVQSEQAVATQRKTELVRSLISKKNIRFNLSEDAGIMKMLQKEQKKINHEYGVDTGFSNNNRKCCGPLILFAVRIKIIKGKLDMPDGDTEYLAKSRLIRGALILNAGGFFDTPFPDLEAWDDQNDLYEQAIENVGLHVLGAEGDKANVKADLKVFLDDACIYVNKIARRNQPQAEAIITSAAMTVITKENTRIPDFGVKNGKNSGEMILRSKAVVIDNKRVRASYEFRYSIDEMETWVYCDSQPTAKKLLIGMVVNGKRVWFSKRTISGLGGTTPWCPPIDGTPR